MFVSKKPIRLAALLAALAVLAGNARGASDYHTFRGKTGTAIEARILSVSDDKSTVKLEDRSGRVFESKITGLSLDDQQFVREWLEQPDAKISFQGKLRAFGTLPNNQRFTEDAATSQTDFVAVAALKSGWLGLRENGQLITYDKRNSGLSGVKKIGANALWTVITMRNGSTRDRTGRTHFPEALNNAEHAVCGAGHHAALLRDRSVVVWGRAYGSPKKPVAPLEPLENIADIASTQGKIAAVDRDGRVFCWDMKTTHINSKLLEGGVVDVEGSIFHFVALTRAGGVIEWTDSSLERIRRPEIDLGGGKAVAVRAGGSTRAARREDGTWVAWGKNASGIVDKINSLPPNVPDLAFFSEPGNSTLGFVVWIEP